jgi:RNA polymerase sigma-70 factor (ECF subfamily)
MYTTCKRYYSNVDDVKSALNLAFLKVVTKLESFLEKEKDVNLFEFWVKRVTINCIIDELRKEKKYNDSMLHADDFRPYETAESSDGENFDLEKIEWAIEKLPPMSKTIFNLHVVEGYKHQEIADMLGISHNTSKVHFHTAKNKLKEMLINPNLIKAERA